MINVVCGIRSTGKICTDLAVMLESQGHEVKIAYGRESVPEQFHKFAVRIGSDSDIKLHGLKARLIDGCGFGSKRTTKKFIKWVKEFDPDVIHLHNLHGYYINIKVLFEYLKESKKKVIWTLHDCWAFTGHCTYFDFVKCQKWKNECKKCPQKKSYPKCTFISNAKYNYKTKKELFTSMNNMILITPSDWLGKIVMKSFLKDYSVKTIHNGIDLNIFRPTPSNIKTKYGLQNKKVILGVAAIWDNRKGLKYMVELAEKLDSSFIVVVIGVTEEQEKQLPKNMLGILNTKNSEELAKWYSLADVFVNTTMEDNYPTTNLEAIACGTPVLTFNTGGSVEAVPLENIVSKGDVNSLVHIIMEDKVAFSDICVDKDVLLRKYLEIY